MDLVHALSLAAELLDDFRTPDLSREADAKAVARLALCLERDRAHRGGFIKQDVDVGSLHRASLATAAVVKDWIGKDLRYEEAVWRCLAFRCTVPELAIAGGFRPPRPRLTTLGQRLRERLSEAMLDRLGESLPDTTPQIGPQDAVFIEAGDPNDKIGQFDRLLDRCGFFEDLERAWASAGKRREDFVIAVKPNIMMIFRLADDGTYTDPALVLRLIERIMERGFPNLRVVETQNLYGNWYGNREVVKVAAHGGYLERGVFASFERGKAYFGRTLVRGQPQPFEVVDMTYDRKTVRFDEFSLGEHELGRAWVEADYRVNFAKFKTHFFNFYTAAVKNTYGCLPEQDKITHYHWRKNTHELTGAQLVRFPVHFNFVDAITAADGLLGVKMRADGPKPGLLLASPSILAMDNVCAQMMAYDPCCSDFFKSAVRATGALRAVRIDGTPELVRGWKRVPAWVDDFSDVGENFHHASLHLGHIFTGDNDPCFPHTGHAIVLRRILAIVPYPILWITNLDQIKVKILRHRLRRFCRAHAEQLPLSAGNRVFFDILFRLSRRDLAALRGFLDRCGGQLRGGAAVERFGHRVRVGEHTLELVGLKHFAPPAAVELLAAVARGEFELAAVQRELDGWLAIEIPAFLRQHLLLDSPYLCGRRE